MILRAILLAALVFTVIELVGLGLWLLGSGVHITVPGELYLIVLIYVEHVVSMVFGYNIGTRKPLFSIP